MREQTRWSRAEFRRVWRGEISLYRAAYGLGGIGFTVLSLLGGVLVSIIASAGNGLGTLAQTIYSAAEIGLVWISVVATWRAAFKQRPGKQRYGPIAISMAFLFVGLQLVFTIAWVSWTGLCALRIIPNSDDIFTHTIEDTQDAESRDLGQMTKELQELTK